MLGLISTILGFVLVALVAVLVLRELLRPWAMAYLKRKKLERSKKRKELFNSYK